MLVDDLDVTADFDAGILQAAEQGDDAFFAVTNDPVGAGWRCCQVKAELADFRGIAPGSGAVEHMALDAGASRGAAEGGDDIVVIGGAVIADDQQHILAGLGDEALDGHLGEGFRVEVIIRVLGEKLGATVADEGEVGVHHHLHALVARTGVGDDHAIGRAVVENVADRVGRLHAFKFRDHRQMIARALDGVADALDHLAGKIDRVFGAIQHQRDDVGLARAQTDPGAIGHISQSAGGFGNLVTGFLFQGRSAPQR